MASFPIGKPSNRTVIALSPSHPALVALDPVLVDFPRWALRRFGSLSDGAGEERRGQGGWARERIGKGRGQVVLGNGTWLLSTVWEYSENLSVKLEEDILGVSPYGSWWKARIGSCSLGECVHGEQGCALGQLSKLILIPRHSKRLLFQRLHIWNLR